LVRRDVDASNALRAAQFEIRLDGFDGMIPRCDLVLCKSGTSTLHVAAWGVPMIVVYRINRLLWHGVGRWVIKSKKIALVNILAGNVDLVPEFVPWYGSNQPVADCALRLLRNPELLEEQRAAIGRLIATLDRSGASASVARIAMEMMHRSESLAQKDSGGTNAAGVTQSSS
jgi:lipid A disaccharide synthetase